MDHVGCRYPHIQEHQVDAGIIARDRYRACRAEGLLYADLTAPGLQQNQHGLLDRTAGAADFPKRLIDSAGAAVGGYEWMHRSSTRIC